MRRVLVTTLLCAVGVAGSLPACFDPSYQQLQCSPAGECPEGYACVAGTCIPPGGIDGPPAPDATPDAVPVDAVPPGECDPVTQRRLSDGAPACGSADPAAPTLGCYGEPEGPFTCQAIPSGAAGRVHGSAVATATATACAPGFQAYTTFSSTDLRPMCAALCRPDRTSLGDAAGANGAPGSGYTCRDRGAPAIAECRYLWFFQDPSLPSIGPINQVGVCFQYSSFVDDTGAPLPSCTSLSADDLDDDGVPQNVEQGCGPL